MLKLGIQNVKTLSDDAHEVYWIHLGKYPLACATSIEQITNENHSFEWLSTLTQLIISKISNWQKFSYNGLKIFTVCGGS